MKLVVFDIEGDGLKPTKIHCLAANIDGEIKATTKYSTMRGALLKADVLVGHNIQLWDIPQIERLLGIKIKAKLVDTLALSWYLYPEENRHGLAEWGEHFGVPKPPIDDWHNLTVDEYIHRCKEDVKINSLLWDKQYALLQRLYEDEESLWRFLDYMSFKIDCAREQERSGWKLDVNLAQDTLSKLIDKKEEVVEQLIACMPKVPIMVKKHKPAKPYKANGQLSVSGCVWRDLLVKHNLPPDYDGEVKVVKDWKEGKPTSPIQVKNWLYSLGWVPETFKYDRDKETGEIKKKPQVNLENGGGLCPSVKKLYPKDENLALLDGLGVVSHRISILNGFLSNQEDGWLQARIAGLTNTLRFKHAELVNLPGVDKAWGKEIRGCLIADDGHELCGSDMSSLEDRLKQHYIYPYDPDYVNEMMAEDYDPHLSLALSAGKVTMAQCLAYADGSDKSITPIRKIFKSGNYACQYGAGPPRLALTAGLSLPEAEMVHAAYWKKNWAVKEVAKNQKTKTVSGQMWLYNPVSGFWYSLRYEKDIFSTLVQGTASYVFDRWVEIVRSKRPQLTAQFHDEIVLHPKLGFREKCEKLLRDAIKQLNDRLKLNRELDIDVQFGNRYSDIH